MDEAASGHVSEWLRSAFPAGTIARVQVLGYGDDPGVEPGQTAMRVFIDRAWRPVGGDADKEIMVGFEQSSHEALPKLLDDAAAPLRVDRVPSGPGRRGHLRAGSHDPDLGTQGSRRAACQETAGEQLTPVMTRVGPDDLATVDTLITAGIASSRADALRWALGRIREHAAYAQLQQRVREIEELKSQF